MRKTIALFAAAFCLLFIALVMGVKPTPPPATPPPPSPPPGGTEVRHPAVGHAAIRIGGLVTLQGALSNGLVPAGQAGHASLLLDLVARDPAASTRPAMAVAIVIDRSGSMAGEKIRTAREAAKQFVARLGDEDEVALITYSTDYAVDLPMTAIKGQRERIDRIIDDVLDGGGTDIGGGLQAGLTALRGAREGTVKRLLLVSDGNANQGITDPAELAAIARSGRDSGITVSTLGLGLDFNEDLLAQMASGAGGAYYYARDPESLRRAFDQELAGLTRLAAQNVEIGLELGAGVRVHEVYGYRTESRAGRLVVPVGDMATGEHRRVMIELETPPVSSGALDVANVVLSYKAAATREVYEHHGALSVTESADASAIASGEDARVNEAFAAAAAARAREQAAQRFQAGDRDGAVSGLRMQIDATKRKNLALRSAALSAQISEMEQAARVIGGTTADSDLGKDIIKLEKARALESQYR